MMIKTSKMINLQIEHSMWWLFLGVPILSHWVWGAFWCWAETCLYTHSWSYLVNLIPTTTKHLQLGSLLTAAHLFHEKIISSDLFLRMFFSSESYLTYCTRRCFYQALESWNVVFTKPWRLTESNPFCFGHVRVFKNLGNDKTTNP